MSIWAQDMAVARALAKMGVLDLDDAPITPGKPRNASPATRRRRRSVKAARKHNRPKR